MHPTKTAIHSENLEQLQSRLKGLMRDIEEFEAQVASDPRDTYAIYRLKSLWVNVGSVEADIKQKEAELT
jgi:hypothetical protein